jgi:hypothetical protein
MVEWRSPALIDALLLATHPWGPNILDLDPENGALLDTVKQRDPAVQTFFTVPPGTVRDLLQEHGHQQAPGLEHGIFGSEPYDQLPRYHTIIQTVHPSLVFETDYATVMTAYRWLVQGGRLATVVDERALRERSQPAVHFQFWLANHMTQTEEAPSDTFARYTARFTGDERPVYRIVIIDRYD